MNNLKWKCFASAKNEGITDLIFDSEIGEDKHQFINRCRANGWKINHRHVKYEPVFDWLNKNIDRTHNAWNEIETLEDILNYIKCVEKQLEDIDNSKSNEVEATSQTVFKYSYKSRGFSPGCQPMNGFLKAYSTSVKFETIEYNRKLSKEEIEEYELIEL